MLDNNCAIVVISYKVKEMFIVLDVVLLNMF